MIFISLLNIAIFQGIVLGAIILKSPLFKSKANNYLAYAILTLSLLLLNLIFEIVEVYNTVPVLRIIDNIEWGFLFPVFIFLFVINRINHSSKQSKKILWLFIPFLYSATLNIFRDLDKIVGLYNIPNSVNEALEYLNLLQVLILPPFIICILMYTYTFIKHIKNAQEKKWITFLWTLVSMVLLSWVSGIVLGLFFDYDVSFFMKLIALFATFLIHWTAYLGVFKYRLAKDKKGINNLLSRNKVDADKNVSMQASFKTETSTESFTSDNYYFQKLEVLCQEHHIYKDNTLNREKVAELLGISSGYVSQLINTITKENFANYINRYRIEAAKTMILESQFENYSLYAIGIESGFSSKTTFYKAFKKVTGITPNAYRKANK